MQKAKRLTFFLLSVLLFSFCYSPWIKKLNPIIENAQFRKFQTTLLNQEQEAKQFLVQLQELDQQQRLTAIHKETAVGDNLSYFIFHNKKLQYWSEDEAVLSYDSLISSKSLYTVGNAVYYKVHVQKKDSLYVGLILLKQDYPYQNRFLKNNFAEKYQYSSISGILPIGKSHFTIKNESGNAVFDLQSKEATFASNTFLYIVSILLLVLAISWIILIPKLLALNRRNTVLFRVLLAVILRSILLIYPPLIWQALPIFNKELMAISWWLPSLADLILSGLTVVYISTEIRKLKLLIRSQITAFLTIIVGTLLSLFSIWIISKTIVNSTISFDLNNIFDLSAYSYLGLIGFGFYFFAALNILALGINRLQIKGGKLFLILFLILFVCTISAAYQLEYSLVYLWFWIPLVLLRIAQKKKFIRPISLALLMLLVTSVSSAYWINKTNAEKNAENSRLILQKLSKEKDPVAEYLFEDLQAKLRSDEYLLASAPTYWSNAEEVNQYIQNRYLKGFWEKYTITITLCKPQDSLYINTENFQSSCINYFQNRIRQEGNLVSSTNLFQLQNVAGRIDYIAEIPLLVDSTNYSIFCEMSSYYLNENEGYPELLLDERTQIEDLGLAGYSYAVYDQGSLLYSSGSYNYSTKQQIAELTTNGFFQYQTDDYQHLVYKKDASTSIVLSSQKADIFSFLTSLAYVLIVFSFAFLFFALNWDNFFVVFQFSYSDFSTKIQLFLISSLLLALVLFGIATTYYIKKQYQLKNITTIEEKIRSISIELESKIGGEEYLSPELESYTSGMLIKFSNVFYTDINLYDLNGQLYATSRPEVFSKGLKSQRMHPKAFYAMSKSQKEEWVQDEQIGKMNYLSAYIPFKNYDNEVLAYLNLPYFAKQGSLQKEISSFLVSTINIYVGIFALALLVSVFLINQLSKPLLLIRQQIGRLKLGSTIELIEWDSNDEIGELVKEYNRIAVELADSAERLAQSERESAWREMAKQVAHEIKNPLTPMKLSIQHLQMASQGDQNELKERLAKTTKTLIEQIDTLSNIANAFSSFAKMPEQKKEWVPLIDLLQSVINLYKNDISISLEFEEILKELKIEADKSQLIRLFNNLIKNAIQATEIVTSPFIQVLISKRSQTLVIVIKDNGIGISEDVAARIFEPNFTTKSSGTGLGLAMSKSIVEQLNGSISFSSRLGAGTTFRVEFPLES